MNPVAPVISAVLFDPGFTYLRLRARSSVASLMSHTSRRTPCPAFRMAQQACITGSLERPGLSGRPEVDPLKMDRLHSNLHG